MATKSKNKLAMIWSIVAIVLAIGSISYCFSVVLLMIESGWEKSTQLLSQIVRIIGGTIG